MAVVKNNDLIFKLKSFDRMLASCSNWKLQITSHCLLSVADTL